MYDSYTVVSTLATCIALVISATALVSIVREKLAERRLHHRLTRLPSRLDISRAFRGREL